MSSNMLTQDPIKQKKQFLQVKLVTNVLTHKHLKIQEGIWNGEKSKAKKDVINAYTHTSTKNTFVFTQHITLWFTNSLRHFWGKGVKSLCEMVRQVHINSCSMIWRIPNENKFYLQYTPLLLLVQHSTDHG